MQTTELKDYKPRLIDETIKFYLTTFGAVLIEGPKWCGKTWTSKNACNSEFLLADPHGNFYNRKIAQLNPDLVLDGNVPRLIDEWQVVPELWDAVIEMEDGSWCGFEIKLGAYQIDQAAKNLLKINNAIMKYGGKGARNLCVICGLSNAAVKREDGVYVVPITSLRP